uniref:3-demethylubiquinone-9 3-methyltransferase n=1 Tax=Parasteatoda tepidariorum TaxID=114398 RepID=A0A2L2YV53_PARTP
MKLSNLRVFLPRQTVTEDLIAVRETAEFYKNLLNASVKVVEAEFRLKMAA